MREVYTQALVLSRNPVGEADDLVVLYTEQYGRIHARAKSVRKITSRVSSHLQPLCLTNVRFMRRNGPNEGFFILDALADGPYKRKLLSVTRIIFEMTDEWERDVRLWKYLEECYYTEIPEREATRNILKILGFDPEHADCMFCKGVSVYGFVPKEHDFICGKCTSERNGANNGIIII